MSSSPLRCQASSRRSGRGGLLFALACELNHDKSHLESEQIKGMVDEALKGWLAWTPWLNRSADRLWLSFHLRMALPQLACTRWPHGSPWALARSIRYASPRYD